MSLKKVHSLVCTWNFPCMLYCPLETKQDAKKYSINPGQSISILFPFQDIWNIGYVLEDNSVFFKIHFVRWVSTSSLSYCGMDTYGYRTWWRNEQPLIITPALHFHWNETKAIGDRKISNIGKKYWNVSICIF